MQLGARGHQELWHREARTLLPVRRQLQAQEHAQQQSQKTETLIPPSLHTHVNCVRSYCSALLQILHLEVHNHFLAPFFLSGNVIKRFPVIKNVRYVPRYCTRYLTHRERWPNKLSFLPAGCLTPDGTDTPSRAAASRRIVCPSATLHHHINSHIAQEANSPKQLPLHKKKSNLLHKYEAW